jgi:hypothetical protein
VSIDSAVQAEGCEECVMPEKRSGSFTLRLPPTTRIQATDLAHREGLSLNQFISIAVAEKITRMEDTFWILEAGASRVPARAANGLDLKAQLNGNPAR